MAVLVVVVAAAVVAAEQQPPPPQQQQQQQRWDTYAAAMLGQGSDLHAASFNPDSFLAEAEEWCASTDRCEAFTYHLEPAVPAAAAALVAGSAPAAAPAPSCPPEACNGHSNRTFCPTDPSPGQCDKPPSPQCPPGPCPNPIKCFFRTNIDIAHCAGNAGGWDTWLLLPSRTVWVEHSGTNCFPGHGGDIIPGVKNPYSATLDLAGCQSACAANRGCTAVTVSHPAPPPPGPTPLPGNRGKNVTVFFKFGVVSLLGGQRGWTTVTKNSSVMLQTVSLPKLGARGKCMPFSVDISL